MRKIDEKNKIYVILNRCYSHIPSNKELELSQIVRSKACIYGGWAPVRNLHSSRMGSQRMLTTSGLAGETQSNILCEIITLHGSLWLLLGKIRKLINLLCRSNTAVKSVVHPEDSHKKEVPQKWDLRVRGRRGRAAARSEPAGPADAGASARRCGGARGRGGAGWAAAAGAPGRLRLALRRLALAHRRSHPARRAARAHLHFLNEPLDGCGGAAAASRKDRQGGGRMLRRRTGAPSLGGQAQAQPRAGRGEHLPATGCRAASGQVRASEAFNKMQLSVSISYIFLLLYGLLSCLKLLTTSDKHWHLPETVFPGLIYTRCYNYPLVPSGRTWDIASKGRLQIHKELGVLRVKFEN
ncbi:uncharacterized protein LOC118577907 [Onychomys torridus]|uniref:uncharacterized protein LOC118577907 n=1 Tax=Onychomys torridus TaxID=38674 RepID=UPI00167F9C1B|nr:uncharacterized protein LOC118577907 [Onychomys torridus]